MSYKKINEDDLAYFISVVGEEYTVTKRDEIQEYGSDHTEDLVYLPEVVVIPKTTKHISLLVKYCNEQKIPVTTRGAGTGLSGGALPVMEGLVISMKRFNQIIDIDVENFQVTTEPGVITQVLQEEVQKKGLFYPPDPASKGSCFIGGNIAENSGGPKAVKYGVTNEYVLNLEVVLASGEIIWTGANVIKNATGYNLTQLVVGSEGTLAIVTKAVLRLRSFPKFSKLLLIPFYSAEKACEMVNEILLSGVVPSGLEFMERDAILLAQEFLNDFTIAINSSIAAHLLVEVDGNDEHVLDKDCERIFSLLKENDCGEVLFADDQVTKDQLWKLRRVVGEAVKLRSVYKEEDTVVPRSYLPKLLRKIKEVGTKYQFESICYGHAGDGNLHVNILKDKMSDINWIQDIPKAIEEIFTFCVEVGGTISGEHGIGFVQKKYMHIPFKKGELLLQKKIKEVFDPKKILNPGKILPEIL